MKLFLLLSLFFISIATATPLQQMYDNAQPRAGYDKWIELDGSQTYSGGFLAIDKKVAIIGNGAVINLQGNGILAAGKGLLDVQGCVFTNGAAAINVGDEIRTTITRCLFYQNDYGVQHFSDRGILKVTNSIFVNQINAVNTNEENLTYLEYNIAYNSSGGHFFAGCGS